MSEEREFPLCDRGFIANRDELARTRLVVSALISRNSSARKPLHAASRASPIKAVAYVAFAHL
jgi:hypothetical protein